jgi:hypothetical protein
VSFLRALRKLVLGETWLLPGAVALALGIAAAARGLAGPRGWWSGGGGWLLLGLLVAGFCVAVLRSGRAR